jgi:hypothetical protein
MSSSSSPQKPTKPICPGGFVEKLKTLGHQDPRYAFVAADFEYRLKPDTSREQYGKTAIWELSDGEAKLRLDTNPTASTNSSAWPGERTIEEVQRLLQTEGPDIRILLHSFHAGYPDAPRLNYPLLDWIGMQYEVHPDMFLPHLNYPAWEIETLPSCRTVLRLYKRGITLTAQGCKATGFPNSTFGA